jgi:predicted phage-related endonuclease
MSPRVAQQLGEEGSDWVPTEWLMQVQQQMDVMGRDCADIAVLLFGRLRIYTVGRHDELIATIHEAAEEMRERIENRDPPEINYQHAGALDTLKRVYPEIAGGGVVLDLNASDAACRYIDLGKQISDLQKARDACKATVLDAMGEAPSAKVVNVDVEFRRLQVKGGKQISYTSKPYVRLTHGKPKP